MGRAVWIRDKKTKAGQPGFWPEKKRIEVVTTFKTCGNVPMTAGMTGVPKDTINTWKKQAWWKEMLDELTYEDNTKLDSKLEKVMDKALDQVMDRLENGEFMYDPRTGKVTRIPAKLRDVQKVVNDSIDKRALIKRKGGGQESEKTVNADHLIMLAKAFAEFSTGKKSTEIPPSLYEGEYTEYVENNDEEMQDEEATS